MKISLDSTCFKNQKFIDFLIEKSKSIEIHLSIIVYVETLIWYLFRGLKLTDFQSELEDLNIKIDLLDTKIANKISNIVVLKNRSFPFKIHARDYFIGMIAVHNETTLITNNIRHFTWLPANIVTPEEFVRIFLDIT